MGEFLLCLFLRDEKEASLIGDFTEEYGELTEKVGPRAAVFWFYKQVFTSVPFLIQRRSATNCNLLLKQFLCNATRDQPNGLIHPVRLRSALCLG